MWKGRMEAMTDRNELERLLAAATEGPWEYRPDEFDEWGVVKSPPREVGNYEPPLILRTVLAQMRDDRRLDEDTLNEHRRAGTDPWEANARLVVFLRNNAQHYLSLMDEVERLRGVMREYFAAKDVCSDYINRRTQTPSIVRLAKLKDAEEVARQALGETHDR